MKSSEVKKEKKVKPGKVKYFSAVGRRKRSIARVRLFVGKGQSLVNQKPLGEFFRNLPSSRYLLPFDTTQTSGKCYVTVKITGGGITGQLEAYIHGVARALSLVDIKNKPILRRAGLLTRDPREKERRKYGLAQSARSAKQSPRR